jgi:hypothetical protein
VRTSVLTWRAKRSGSEIGRMATQILRLEIMGPPILWDDSAGFNGKRITAVRWDASLPPAAAAKRAGRAIAIWLTGKTP